MVIGICDDKEKDRGSVKDFCIKYIKSRDRECEFRSFTSGEEVLDYCNTKDNKRIDLLFLDIEMDGIDGIEVKNRILRQDLVWRIVFVSAIREKVFESFGLKTLGFVLKPASEEEIGRWVGVVLEELKENTMVEISGAGAAEKRYIRQEDIDYFLAEGNYTKIVLHTSEDSTENHILITKKIGDLEREYEKYPFVRVHKSYMVNLENVTAMSGEISFRDSEKKIPIGRTYKEEVRKKYWEFCRIKMKERM